MTKYWSLFIIGLMIAGCNPAKVSEQNKGYKSEGLIIQKVAEQVYQHISFLDAGSFGLVPCNGMIVFSNGEAIIFDTPADLNASLELINWVERKLNCKIKAVIPTHFHADCLAGLDEFHQRGIPSYANNLTIALARANLKAIPRHGFDSLLELKVGDKRVIAEFLGEGHTKDNMIGYFPEEGILFGGCLIKESGAGKGNVKDANIHHWPLTVKRVKEKYPDTKVVIPGHGKAGGTELFDYTMNLFEQK